MKHYYLTRWIWDETKDPVAWRAPNGAIDSFDLRTESEQAQSGGTGGYGIFVYETEQTIPGAVYLGTDFFSEDFGPRQGGIQNQTEADTALGVTTDTVQEPKDYLWELLVNQGDATGETKWKPFVGRHNKTVDLYVGNQLVRQEFTRPEGKLHRNAIDVYQADYRRHKERGAPLEVLQRFTGHKMQEFYGKMDDPTADKVMPQEHRKDGWKRPSTTAGDTFNRADNTDLNAADTGKTTDGSAATWDWTVNVGAMEIVSNEVTHDGATEHAHARAGQALSTDDMYSEIEVIDITAGNDAYASPTVRASDSAVTYYVYLHRTSAKGIYKRVAGTFSEIKDLGDNAANGVARTEVFGGVIRGVFDGDVVGTTNDTSITGNLYAGISLRQTGDTGDNFAAGDIDTSELTQPIFFGSAVDTSDTTTYTFSDQYLGTASSDRSIIVTVNMRKAGDITTVAVTVGGVSATKVAERWNDSSGANLAGIYIANVPTGTEGDIVVTFGESAVRAAIGVYYATNLRPTVHDDLEVSSSGALNIPAGGFGIGTATTSSDGDAFTWTGLTEDYDEPLESQIRISGANQKYATEQKGLTVTASTSGSNQATAIASWGFKDITTDTSFTYIGSKISTSETSTYTFSDEYIGEAAANRTILVSVSLRKAGSSSTSVSVSIGGVSATEAASQWNTDSGGNFSGVFYAVVPTGESGDVVVTLGTAAVRCIIGTYYSINLNSTVADTLEVDGADADPTGTIDIPAGGFAIASAVSTADTVTSWTGLSEDFDEPIAATSTHTGASTLFETQQTGLTVTADFTTATDTAMAVGSFEFSTDTFSFPPLSKVGGINKISY